MPRLALIACFTLVAFSAHAQVEHKKQWHPVRTVTAEAPAPTRTEEREQEFAQRRSPAALAKLARETFGLLNRDYRPKAPSLAALYASAFAKFDHQDYAGAIEGYRDFFLARLRGGETTELDPSKRTFVEFFNEADLLMQDEILIATFDEPIPDGISVAGIDSILNYYSAGKHNAHMVNVRMRIGPPGRINWVYQPDFVIGPTVHLPTDQSFLANAYSKDMFFTPLLAACVETQDPKYLVKWAEIVDDFLLNHRRDVAEAALNLAVGWGGAGGINSSHLLYVLNKVPDAEKVLPADTLVRLLQRNWVESLPLLIRGTRVGGPNRIRADSPHDYQLNWSLKPDRPIPAGWSSKGKPVESDPTAADVKANLKGYAKNEIVFDPAASSIKTQNPRVPNLSLYSVATTDLRLTPGEIRQNHDKVGNAYQVGPAFTTKDSAVVTTLLYPRRDIATDLQQFHAVKDATMAGFDAVTASGAGVSYRAALSPTVLTAGPVTATASVLLVAGGSGFALDCTDLGGNEPPRADFTFRIEDGRVVFGQPIERPLELVTIRPAADVFTDSVDVTMSHPAPDVDIRYTLDASVPTLESSRYTEPVTLTETTWVKARAFRTSATTTPPTEAGTTASSLHTAWFTKSPIIPAIAPSHETSQPHKDSQPGLAYSYYEDDWTISNLKLPILEPVSTGVARDLEDFRAVRSNANSYALVYEGTMTLPTTGVYTFHAPSEYVSTIDNCGYDLRLFLDGQEWYPGTRRHNFGDWSVALERGGHAVRVVYVDQRRGDLQASKEGDVGAHKTWKGDGPKVMVTGPDGARQSTPAAWFSHGR